MNIETELRASAVDDESMSSCTLYVDDEEVATMDVNNGYAMVDYTFSEVGTAEVYAYCIDVSGNATSGSAITVTIVERSTEDDRAVGAVEAGTLIKLPCSGDTYADSPCRAVYYYDTEEGKRHAFPNEAVFFTWYDDFDDVTIVTQDLMSSLTLGANVTYHPGATMVKFVSVNTVYAVGEEGELRAIGSEETAEDIFGSDWNQQIDDISDAFFGNYDFGDDIDDEDDYDPDDVYDLVDDIEDIL